MKMHQDVGGKKVTKLRITISFLVKSDLIQGKISLLLFSVICNVIHIYLLLVSHIYDQHKLRLVKFYICRGLTRMFILQKTRAV